MTTDDEHIQHGWHSGETWDAAHRCSVQWTVPIRYQNLTYIGQGAFVTLLRATDTTNNKSVAIKKLCRPFLSEKSAKRTYRRLKILQHLNHSDAEIVQLYDVFTPEERFTDFQTVYFVLKFVDYNLDQLIRIGMVLIDNHIRMIIYSLLRGLKFMHSANIIHRNITPSNIGIASNSDVAILDVGLAPGAPDHLHTEFVVRRWWRAPELMVRWVGEYDGKVDVWSVGCIMAELLRHTPLFPGNDDVDQLVKIFQVIGTPTEQELHEVCLPEAHEFILKKVPNVPPADFHTLFPTLSDDGIDFLQRLLRFDPRQRPTAEEALSHPFLAAFHDPTDEPTASPIDGLHDDAEHPMEQWKVWTWQLIRSYPKSASGG